MFDHVRADTQRLRTIKSKPFPWYVLESLLFENGYQAVLLYRAAHWCKRRRLPALGPLLARVSLWLTGVDIAPAARIGPGLMISHGVGLVIGHRARIGRNALLLQQATIGAASLDGLEQMPQIGDDVFIAAGARVIGAVRIGDRVFIGANAVVSVDVEDGMRVTAEQQLRIRPRRDLDAADA